MCHKLWASGSSSVEGEESCLAHATPLRVSEKQGVKCPRSANASQLQATNDFSCLGAFKRIQQLHVPHDGVLYGGTLDLASLRDRRARSDPAVLLPITTSGEAPYLAESPCLAARMEGALPATYPEVHRALRRKSVTTAQQDLGPFSTPYLAICHPRQVLLRF